MLPFGETSQLVARPGTTPASGVKRVRPSKRYPTARPVGTSVESAGSSERGSYWSRESTTVCRNGAPDEPHAASTSVATKTSRGRVSSIDTGKVARELTRSCRQASIGCARPTSYRAGALHVTTAERPGGEDGHARFSSAIH